MLTADHAPRNTHHAPRNTQHAPRTTLYLPRLARSDDFWLDLPIWSHADAPAAHEVVLFRRSFTLDAPLEGAELHIFADTRYEVWLDGAWVGRGPARFSPARREYDVYPLGALPAGPHLLAALVQWAPNERRAESTAPSLQAHVAGTSGGSARVVARSGADWRAWPADAWRQDSAPVYAGGIVGPTELLDLRQLPADWMSPGFSDLDWPSAVVRPATGAAASPRSIPLLESAPVTVTVVETGRLSPGRALGVLAAPTVSHTLAFEALQPTLFAVEVLSNADAAPLTTIRLDGAPLVWQPVADRPDVVVAAAAVLTGPHALTFAEVPAAGLAFAVSTQDVRLDSVPFQPAAHAGLRLLLAEPLRSLSGASAASAVEGSGTRPERRPSAARPQSKGAAVHLEFSTLPAYAVLDLGRTVHGRLTARVSGPAGTVVDIGWDERLWRGARPLPYPGSLHPGWNQVDSWTLDGASRVLTTLDARAGRYVLIAVWGDGPVRLDDIRVEEERYPAVQQGSFHSSDPLLDAIWQVGVDTLRPNMTDAYTDTPWRERGQWLGDLHVEQHVNRVAFGDVALLRRGLRFAADAFADGRPPALAPNADGTLLLDYGMVWAQSLADYGRSTGDVGLLAEVYPALQDFIAYLDGYTNPSTGLLDVPPGPWYQTALIDWAAEHSRTGQSTALNAMAYGTLLDAASVAEAVGDPVSADAYRQRAERLRQQVNAHLYLPAEHRYVTTILAGEPYPPTVHAQAWPLAYGLAPEDEVEPLVASLQELLVLEPIPNVEVYGMFWLLEALGRSGHVPQALEIIESSYGRLLARGATTWPEGWESDQHYYSSMSHGWGGSPTWFLTTYVLGARQTGPASWSARPAFGSVTWASGALPLTDGALVVDWRRVGDGQFALDITSPSGTAGEAIIPVAGATTTIAVNGTLVWETGAARVAGVTIQADGVHVPLSGGRYTISVYVMEPQISQITQISMQNLCNLCNLCNLW